MEKKDIKFIIWIVYGLFFFAYALAFLNIDFSGINRIEEFMFAFGISTGIMITFTIIIIFSMIKYIKENKLINIKDFFGYEEEE